MNRRQILKVITGHQPGDEVAALAAELETKRQKGAEASSRLELLELERKTADDFAAAKALDDQIAEAEWTIERADALLPHLESRLKAARPSARPKGLSAITSYRGFEIFYLSNRLTDP
jgi:uncharacterized coiled-coil protein SlyX